MRPWESLRHRPGGRAAGPGRGAGMPGAASASRSTGQDRYGPSCGPCFGVRFVPPARRAGGRSTPPVRLVPPAHDEPVDGRCFGFVWDLAQRAGWWSGRSARRTPGHRFGANVVEPSRIGLPATDPAPGSPARSAPTPRRCRGASEATTELVSRIFCKKGHGGSGGRLWHRAALSTGQVRLVQAATRRAPSRRCHQTTVAAAAGFRERCWRDVPPALDITAFLG